MSKHVSPPLVVIGKGGGGGSSKGGSVGGGVIAQNTLQSNTIANIVEMLSEGPIEGLVAGAQSIYFNETPLQNADGSYNWGGLFIYLNAGQYDSNGNQVATSGYYPVAAGTSLSGDDQWLSGVAYTALNGDPDQEVLPGFPSSQTTTTVNEQIQNSIGPVVRTIEDTNTTAVLVSIGIPNLSTLDPTTGNLNAASVSWTIDVAPYGGEYVNQVSVSINNEKTTSLYLYQSQVILPPGGAPWNIRVTRTCPDNLTNINVQNQTWWESYTEVVMGQFMYPNTAIIGLSVNSQFFGSTIPTRAYYVKGLITDVPSNYDPVARTYTGVWDGTFKQAWHNNPAWVFYALCVNSRWGLGEFVDASIVDKWGLYAIAQYCDELVPSGFTNPDDSLIYEPRFVFNGVINNRDEAYKVLQNVASAFRGMAYWSLGQVFATADMPKDPIATFAPANVTSGHFQYSGTAMKARHSVAAVSWNDPQDFYRPAIQLVQSDAMLQLFGWRQIDIAAPGCTSIGQANRYGKWILYTEQYETETVQFTISWDQYILSGGQAIAPGAIIYVADPRKTGSVRIGGRLKAVGSTSDFTIDAPFVPTDGDSYTLTIAQPDGTIETQDITAFDATNTILTTAAFGQTPQVGAMWVISGTDVNPRQYRVLSVQEQDSHLFKITALFFDPDKFAAVEEDLVLAPPTYVRPNNVMAPPSNPVVTESNSYNNGTAQSCVTLSWTQPISSIATNYNVTANGPSGNVNFGSTQYTSIDIYNLTPGNWTFYIVAVSTTGVLSTQLPIAVTVQGWSAVTVPTATSLALLGGGTVFSSNAPTIVWTNEFPENTPSYPINNMVRVYDPTTNTLLRTETVSGLTYTYSYDKNLNDGGPRRSLTFTVTAVSLLGVEQSAPASLTVTNPQPAAVAPQVTSTGDTINIQWSVSDNDYAGSMVWIYPTSGTDITTISPVYTGTDLSFTATEFTPGTYYVRVGAYDQFGTTGMTVGSEVPIACTGVNLAALSSELGDYLANQLTALNASNQDTQSIIATAASEQDANNWLDKYNTRSIVATQVATLVGQMTDDVNSLLSTISSDVATLNNTISTNYGTLNTAISTAVTTSETYTDSAISTNNSTLETIYATQTALSQAQSSAVSTAESYTDTSIASLNNTIEATYATQTSVTSAINTAISGAETTASNALSAYETTVNATFATQSALTSGLASTLSSAETSASNALSTYETIVNAEIGGASSTVTISIASPAVITLNNHGFLAGQGLKFSTTGALPTGLTTSNLYYVIATGLQSNSFQVSATAGGTAVNTSGTQSGTQSIITQSLIAGITSNATATATLSGTVSSLSNTLTADYTTTGGMNTAINSALTTAESYADGVVATLSNTLTTNYTTTTGMNSAISTAQSAAESYANAAVTTLSNTLTANYSTTTQVSGAINTALSTAESFATNAVATLSNTLTTNYTTTTGMNSAISTAQSAAESFATSAVAALSSTLTADYTTTTGMNSAIASAQSTAESYASSAITSLSNTLTASIGSLSASGQFQVVSSAGVSGATSQITMQVSATENGTFVDAGITLAAFVDQNNNTYSQIQFSADQTQFGIPDETGGDFVTPFAVQNVDGNSQVALVPTMIPDDAITTRSISSGAVSTLNLYTGSDVTRTYTAWNNGGAGAAILSQTINISAGSALRINFTTGLVGTGSYEGTFKLTMLVNGTAARTMDFTTGGNAYDFDPYYAFIYPMEYLATGLSAGSVTVELDLYVSATGTGYTVTAKAPQFIIEEIKNAQVNVGTATPPTPSIAYQTTIFNGTSSTLSAVPIGAANSYRTVVVALGWMGSSYYTPSMAINGIKATTVYSGVTPELPTPQISIFSLRVPAGTTADMVISGLGSSASGIVVSVWSVISFNSAPVTFNAATSWSYNSVSGYSETSNAGAQLSVTAGQVGIWLGIGNYKTATGFNFTGPISGTSRSASYDSTDQFYWEAADFSVATTASDGFTITNANANACSALIFVGVWQ